MVLSAVVGVVAILCAFPRQCGYVIGFLIPVAAIIFMSMPPPVKVTRTTTVRIKK